MSRSPAAVAESSRAFGVALYKRLGQEPGNLFVSPTSIHGAFGPALAGAQGENKQDGT